MYNGHFFVSQKLLLTVIFTVPHFFASVPSFQIKQCPQFLSPVLTLFFLNLP